MKNNTVRFVFMVVTLVMGLALEEMLPKVFGMGFPVLLGSVFFFSTRKSLALPIFLATCAGAGEDAISSLPFFTSVSYFLLVLFVLRLTKMPYVLAAFLYPIYQIWLCAWAPSEDVGVFSRVLAAFPIGVITMTIVTFALERALKRVGFDEEG